MFGFLFAIALGVSLWLIARGATRSDPRQRLTKVLVAGFVLRLVIQLFLRNLAIFSHGATSGDNLTYDYEAVSILKYWDIHGFTYVTNTEFPGLGAASLPPNLFALVDYLNGGEATQLGCTAVVAFCASLACLELFLLAVGTGAQERPALLIAAAMNFSPAYLYYTSDTFKDGLVAFLIISATRASFQLAHKMSIGAVVRIVVLLFCLWGVRFYLVFLAVIPFVIGFVGAGSRSILRPLLTVLFVALAAVAVARTSSTLEAVTERMNETYEHATAVGTLQWNSQNNGSGVQFDDGGSPTGRLWLKTIYTVLSPFPWQGGSIALQVGKIDALLFGFLMYRSFRASRDLMRRDRTLILMFLSIIVPLTVAYATTISNIGLIVRQRIPIVLITASFAALSWPREQEGGAPFARVRETIRGLGARRRRAIPKLRPYSPGSAAVSPAGSPRTIAPRVQGLP